MHLFIAYPMRPRRRTVHTSLVGDHFGVGDDPPPHVVARDLDLPIMPGTIVTFTGPSGSGKSSLLNAVVANLERSGSRVLRCEAGPLPDVAVIDAVGLGFAAATAVLSTCGLADPRLMLRRPCELSDGERWRFRMALALSRGPQWIAVDEFTAALDRTLARVVAYNLRRQCDRTGVGFLVATCHDDVLADLSPDLHVRCDHDGAIELERRRENTGDDTNQITKAETCSVLPANSKSRPERRATGRISLGGITGRIASAEFGS